MRLLVKIPPPTSIRGFHFSGRLSSSVHAFVPSAWQSQYAAKNPPRCRQNIGQISSASVTGIFSDANSPRAKNLNAPSRCGGGVAFNLVFTSNKNINQWLWPRYPRSAMIPVRCRSVGASARPISSCASRQAQRYGDSPVSVRNFPPAGLQSPRFGSCALSSSSTSSRSLKQYSSVEILCGIAMRQSESPPAPPGNQEWRNLVQQLVLLPRWAKKSASKIAHNIHWLPPSICLITVSTKFALRLALALTNAGMASRALGPYSPRLRAAILRTP
jgi:hypothetical protein